MAVNMITLDVYEIDGQPTRFFQANFASNSETLPYYGNNPNLYAVVVGIDQRHYAVVQTVAAIRTTANT